MVVLSNHAVPPSMRRRCLQLGADAVFDKATEVDDLIDYRLRCRQARFTTTAASYPPPSASPSRPAASTAHQRQMHGDPHLERSSLHTGQVALCLSMSRSRLPARQLHPRPAVGRHPREPRPRQRPSGPVLRGPDHGGHRPAVLPARRQALARGDPRGHHPLAACTCWCSASTFVLFPLLGLALKRGAGAAGHARALHRPCAPMGAARHRAVGDRLHRDGARQHAGGDLQRLGLDIAGGVRDAGAGGAGGAAAWRARGFVVARCDRADPAAADGAVSRREKGGGGASFAAALDRGLGEAARARC